MNTQNFKPTGYNALSPYLIVDDARKLVELLKTIFNAKELRRFEDEKGRIMHIELRIDDSVIMIAESTADYPAHKMMLHVYVPDAKSTFELALANGCEIIEYPAQKPGDPDIRGSFYDVAGNYWAVGTQSHSN